MAGLVPGTHDFSFHTLSFVLVPLRLCFALSPDNHEQQQRQCDRTNRELCLRQNHQRREHHRQQKTKHLGGTEALTRPRAVLNQQHHPGADNRQVIKERMRRRQSRTDQQRRGRQRAGIPAEAVPDDDRHQPGDNKLNAPRPRQCNAQHLQIGGNRRPDRPYHLYAVEPFRIGRHHGQPSPPYMPAERKRRSGGQPRDRHAGRAQRNPQPRRDQRDRHQQA